MIFFFSFFNVKRFFFFPAEWKRLFLHSLILQKVATDLVSKSWINLDMDLNPQKAGAW